MRDIRLTRPVSSEAVPLAAKEVPLSLQSAQARMSVDELKAVEMCKIEHARAHAALCGSCRVCRWCVSVSLAAVCG